MIRANGRFCCIVAESIDHENGVRLTFDDTLPGDRWRVAIDINANDSALQIADKLARLGESIKSHLVASNAS